MEEINLVAEMVVLDNIPRICWTTIFANTQTGNHVHKDMLVVAGGSGGPGPNWWFMVEVVVLMVRIL